MSTIYEDNFIEARKASKRLKVYNHPKPPKIVYDRPVPQEARGGVRKHDHFYPFEEMKPGGSFWIASEKGARGCTAGAITKFAKKSGWKFTSRGETEDGEANRTASKGLRGMRVWRVK